MQRSTRLLSLLVSTERSYPPESAGTLRPVRLGVAVRTGMRGCEVQEAGKVPALPVNESNEMPQG
ncbi:hypothetical protein K458DRAFT_425338 [Lentithecium fluviatile CBS 122367]|uniref:Uncharacterized protein n=1 Tax=Lentithecium fluviatile CBS 122367 TaxID=1168545 RepID=A0A6G1ICJ2_9PLEO|nr:hypothetical protein K458DRAFT_425338 [Lentithecium fluviatile CBS 122367]